MNPVLDRYKTPESNLFLMTRFRETPYHQAISDSVEYAAKAFGLEFVRADDKNFPGTVLWDRVQACIDACHYGVAVFEAIDETEFNPNIALELGYMRALKRQCLVLKEQRLKNLPTDLCGEVYKPFDSMNISATLLAQMADWFKEVGVRKRDQEELVVFVSTGGTCRCAIAKAIVRQLLARTKDSGRIRAESRAVHRPILRTGTKAGISAVKNVLGSDLLSDHRTRRAGVGFLFEADLILAMDARVLRELGNLYREYQGEAADMAAVEEELRRKMFLVTEFFGSSGNIEDPYIDQTVAAYEKCVNTLKRLIAPKINVLTAYLSDAASNPTLKRTVAFGNRRLSP